MSPARLRRADRILHSRDFRDVIESGERLASGQFVVFVAAARGRGERTREPRVASEDGQRTRLGITVSRKVGNSVVRNRVKRGVREWFRHSRAGLPAASRIVVIARRAARDLSGVELHRALDRVMGLPEGTR